MFGDLLVPREVSSSLANSWAYSLNKEQSIDFTCDRYDNGDTFTNGCAWQLKVDSMNYDTSVPLTWSSPIVKCTNSQQAPKCAPFTKCVDPACA